LKFALADEFEDWRDGEMMLQSMLLSASQVERASARQRELELMIVKAGGICGPGTIGDAYDTSKR
jgi:hypothetical protein